MKIWSLVLMMLLLSVGSQTIVSVAKIQDKKEPITEQPLYTREELVDLSVFSYIVVQFTDRKGDIFSGEFKSRFSYKPFDFKLLPNGRGWFSKGSKDGYEPIIQEEFLKKFKDNFWWVQYRKIGTDNFIYQAAQIPSLLSMAKTFAQDLNDNYQTIEMVEFWDALKSNIVTFSNFDTVTSQLTWEFRVLISETKDKVLDRGTFELSPYCVFSAIRAKTVGSKSKTVDAPLDLNYFKANFNKRYWMVFYSDYNPYHPESKDQPLKLVLRMVTHLKEATPTK